MTTEAAAGLRPFTLSVPQDVLDDLKERLRRTRFPDEIPGSGWTYGTNLAYLRELVGYWLNQYDWRAAEAQLNAWPQFTASVGGLDLHFAYIRGSGPNPAPLLISHGWPGSFFEMLDVIGPLTNPAAHGGDPADAFDLVVPSLPGYGFSAHPRAAGMTPQAIGELFTQLMSETLGYRRYFVQGGDWGAVITAAMAHQRPDQVVGLHLNMLGVRPYTGAGTPPITPEEQAFMAEAEQWRLEETGYQWIQGTRPQTLAYGLTDSPAGLAAWIVEKFRAWSDCGGELERRFSKDELLANVTLYWVTQTINSSIRLYYASRQRAAPLGPGERVTVPTGVALTTEAVGRAPREWAERTYNVRRWTELPRGGHFTALEEPELLAEDIRAFFRPLRPSHASAQ